MHSFKLFTHSVLLTTTSSLFASPQNCLPHIECQIDLQTNLKEKQTVANPLSYDDIMTLLEEIESGELEEKASMEDLERINQFVALLAKEGSLDDDDFFLECDIAALLDGGDRYYDYAFAYGIHDDCLVVPAIFNESGEIIFCKSWASKQWHQTRKFVKKHKKAIIIGAIVVVAVTAVVVAVVVSSASAAAAGATSAAAAVSAATSDAPSKVSVEPAPVLKAVIDDQVASFKETIIREQLFQDSDSAIQGLSIEENGRTLGSLFAHESFKHLEGQLSDYPTFATEIQSMGSQFQLPIRSPDFGHPEIDRKFSTDYSSMYFSPTSDADFSTLAFQVRGEKALASGYFHQAIDDLSRAIEFDPANPLPWLERGVAHFGLGEYEQSIEDYRQYTAQTQKEYPLSVADFSFGFAKGLPKGIYESGEGLFLFLTDLVKHPIHTSGQIIDSITTLVNLVQNDEWGVVAEALSPEVHQLVTQWDTLSSDQRGELAGYAVGKHGADILVPGAIVKVAGKSVKSAQELAAICKNLQIAQETLLLESVAGWGNSARIAEALQFSQKTIGLAEELGFPIQEIVHLKQAGQLEEAVAKTVERFAGNSALRESWELFKKAETFLEPHCKKFLSEPQARELIHQMGIRTFSRPAGLPEHFKVRITESGAGMEYVHPTNMHISVRVMPGKPHSPNPSQQKPYVIQMKDGKAIDKYGNRIDRNAPEAHIPIDEFSYKNG